MKFREYNEIENSYRTKVIDLIVDLGLHDKEWVVTEKVHGCNASFWYDGQDLKIAKRSSFIGEGENFGGAKKVKDDNQSKVIELFKLLNLTSTDTLVVFGEIFGGSYPHPDVKKVQATQIQKGIYYTPDNLFYAFDIKVNDNYLDYDKCVELFDKVGIFYAKVLKRGTLKEALEYPNEFDSTIPALLGLPPITPNITEGVVIKPIVSSFFPTGQRVIIKNKNDKWKEKSTESKHPREPKEPDPELTEPAQKLLEIYNSFICENRLKNVLSKLGTITNKDFGKILGALSIDANKDFEKEHGEEFIKLDDKEQKRIKKLVATNATLLIRTNFINIIDGNF